METRILDNGKATSRQLSPAALLLALLFLFSAPVDAKERLTIDGFSAQVLGDRQPAAAATFDGAPLFTWPQQLQLSAELRFTLAGYDGARGVDLFAALFEDRPGLDPKDAAPLAKLKGQHDLPAGRQRLAFPALWRSDEVPGLRRYRVELEVGVKGGEPAKQTLYFTVNGPPLPTVKLLSLDIWNPASPRQEAFWQPGETLQANLLVELRGNQSRRGPTLLLYAAMDEDREQMGLDDKQRRWQPAANWDALALPPEDGVYQCLLQARLPVLFHEPWDSQHPFKLHAALDYGAGDPAAIEASGAMVDYHPGEERTSTSLDERLISLDPATRWTIKRVAGRE